jgi:CRP/FNR family cyclic AMP-dependent transcriptional regulator
MSLKEEYELLRRVPYFAEIEPAKLKLLAFMSERVAFDPGKRLFRQGDPGDAAYLIISGEAEVTRETLTGPVLLATLGANEIVGDMAILGNVPRNATVRAKGRLVTLRISKEPFMRMVREFPSMAVAMMQELAERLASTNDQLSATVAELRRVREQSGIAA